MNPSLTSTRVLLSINELMAKNKQSGKDEDGEFDDWIELYNLADAR